MEYDYLYGWIKPIKQKQKQNKTKKAKQKTKTKQNKQTNKQKRTPDTRKNLTQNGEPQRYRREHRRRNQ